MDRCTSITEAQHRHPHGVNDCQSPARRNRPDGSFWTYQLDARFPGDPPKPAATIQLRPTPQGYANMLRLIIESSTSATDRVWAAEELVRVQPAITAGKWSDEE